MTAEVNEIASRLSLRAPQRRSLEILGHLCQSLPLLEDVDLPTALHRVSVEYPSVTDFERDFPSLCFALATGVGKTRLMGAFISYLHQAHGVGNFFVLAPSLTIYNKLIADFTPNTPKYVFAGISQFAVQSPSIVTGETYEYAGTLLDSGSDCTINVFNISKINTEVRGGKSPKIKRLSEYIGESYFDYLAGLPDLVLLMDESHRYRASAGVRAINELQPIFGLELTATPFTEASTGPVPFKNVVFDYPLSSAMADGFVKEPAVATRKNFSSAGMGPDEIELIKLEDGVRLHEVTKVELSTYAMERALVPVKPFVLIIARDTTHAAELEARVQSASFFGGRYKGKVLQVDSSRTGLAEEEMIERLLQVESAHEPTEIVIHVNMLKEGWDVTNLYTIIPLRAANARTLIEQSIGRGLRLPYGKRTGVAAVDRLTIVAHDRFQEIIDEANRVGSKIRLQSLVFDPADLSQETQTVVVYPNFVTRLGLAEKHQGDTSQGRLPGYPVQFTVGADVAAGRLAVAEIGRLAKRPDLVPNAARLADPAVKAAILQRLQDELGQQHGSGAGEAPADLPAIVDVVVEQTIRDSIEIPRIAVVPTGQLEAGFEPFRLDLSMMRYAEVSADLWLQYLRTGLAETIAASPSPAEERSEDYVVAALSDFDDVSYERDVGLLYELAAQVVEHFESYLPTDHVSKVLAYHQKTIASAVHAQMQQHYWEKASGYEAKVSQGFTPLKESVFTGPTGEAPRNFRVQPEDKSRIGKYVFGGFSKCLYSEQKFQSDPERVLAIVLDRESLKWFRPARGQFQLFYKHGASQLEYQPDFVAETPTEILMLEPKRKADLQDPVVIAKADAARLWCERASVYGLVHGGKPWKYVLIPHDAIAENVTLDGLLAAYERA